MVFGLFKKKKNKYINLEVSGIIQETADAVTLVFHQPKGNLDYHPGQFLTLIFDIDGTEVRRSYSLCSSPFTGDEPAVTIKRVSDGTVSNFINDHIKVGDSIKALPAMGHFIVNPDNANKRKVVVFGAGSGITPLFSILKSILHVETGSTVFLIYGNRNEESIIFKSLIDQLQETYGDRFNVIHMLSQPSEKWKGYTGRLTVETISQILMDLPGLSPQQADYFLCGPTGFMHNVEEALQVMRVKESRIHKESFVTSGSEKDASISSPEIVDQQVKIILDGDEYKVDVPSKRTILEAGLDKNLDLPFSCQSGLCTACRGKLLSGKVHMEESDGLTREDLENGYILCCVSHPLTDDVKVEIG
jgi:ring-1,2-phenylacetyl-CoA epoxidase subunit PaaE